MTHTTRALELLFQAIREVESREELGRLSATARELYGGRGHDETFHTLMLAIEARGGVLAARLEQAEMFPPPPPEGLPDHDIRRLARRRRSSSASGVSRSGQWGPTSSRPSTS